MPRAAGAGKICVEPTAKKLIKMQANYRGLVLPSCEGPVTGDHQILTTKEVSEMLGVHTSTVYKLIKEGKIPSFRVGSVGASGGTR